MIVIDILRNLSILVALSAVSGLLENKWTRDRTTGKLAQGILFGIVAIVGMMDPFVLEPGLIFDGRSVVLSLCGLFFGPLPAVVAGIMSAIYRISIGGHGAIIGTSVITSSVIIGLLFHYYASAKKIKINTLSIYLLGLTAHIAMVLLMFLLPSASRAKAFEVVALTTIVFYPLATVLSGSILRSRSDNIRLMKDAQDSNQRYELIASNSVDVIWFSDTNFKVKYVSPSVINFYGYSVEEFKALPLSKLMSEESYNKAMALIKGEIENQSPASSQWRIIETEEYRKDGTKINVEARISFVKNGSSDVIGLVGVSRDITRRKESERKVAESEEKYRLLVENVSDLIVKVDKNQCLLYVSDSYCELFGKSEDELIGKQFMLLVHEDDRSKTIEEMKKLYREPYSCYVEQRADTAIGWRWIAWIDTAVLNSNNEIEYIIGVGRDITERKEAEQALKESETLFKTIVENLPFNFWTIDSDSRFIYQNRGSIEFWGDCIGKTVDEIPLSEKVKSSWISSHKKALAGETVRELVPIDKSGRTFNFERLLIPTIVGYNITGAIGIAIDLSERTALQNIEAKYKQLIENISGEYFLHREDLNHRFTFLSSSVTEVLGYQPEELLNKPNYGGTLVDSPQNKLALAFTNSAAEGIKKPTYLLESKHKDGSLRWIEVTEFPVFDANNRVIAIEGISKDVTDRKRYEEAIQKQVLALTRPISDSTEFTFEELFDLNEIQKIQDLFASAVNVASVITKPDGTPITKASNFTRLCGNIIRNTEKGRADCYKYDALAGKHFAEGISPSVPCHAEMWHAGAAILIEGRHIANWLIGQFRDEYTDFKKLELYAEEIGADKDEFMKAFNEIPIIKRDKFEQIAGMLQAIANELSLKAYQNMQQARFIADINKAKDAASQSELTFQTIFQSNASLMYVSDYETKKIIDANQSFLDELKYTKEEIIGKTSLEVGFWVAPEDREYISKVLAEKGYLRNFETKIITKDKQVKHILLSCDIILMHKESHLLFILLDISDRILAEERLRQLNTELESIVEQRTKDLNNTLSQLQNSNMELQALNEQMSQDAMTINELNEDLTRAISEKDKFFSIIAHDLKNPFVALISTTDMLLHYFDKFDETKKKEMLAQIKTTSQSTYSLLENLLEWSRSQMGRIELQPHFIDMFDLAFKTVNVLLPQAQAKNVKIKVSVQEDSYAYCDQEMITTVLRNLISNAIKFSKPGSQVEMSLSDMVIFSDSDKSKSKPYAVYYVKDFGVGIEPNKLEKLFTIGESLSTRGTSGERGTGLGLLICKEFIERHGGKIWVESQLNVGTTFYFSLPMS